MLRVMHPFFPPLPFLNSPSFLPLSSPSPSLPHKPIRGSESGTSQIPEAPTAAAVVTAPRRLRVIAYKPLNA